MKRPSANLFNLIKSLSVSEKRYFRLFAARQEGDKNYMELFEAIDSLAGYDETVLKTKLKTPTIIKFLKIEKQHLQEVLLKSLRNFHEKLSEEIQLNQLLSDIEILFRKGLYPLCSQKLKKAKKLAQQQEHFVLLLQLFKWEEKISYVTDASPIGKQEIEKNYTERKNVLKQIDNLMEYHKIRDIAKDLSRNLSASREEKERKKIRAILDLPLLKTVDMAISYQAKESFYFLRCWIAEALFDYASFYENSLQTIKLMESNPEKKTGVFLIALCNLGLSQISCKKHEECRATIKKAKAILDSLPKTSVKTNILREVGVRIHNLELSVNILSGEFKKAEKSILDFETLPPNQKPVNERLILIVHYNYALVYFGLSQYSKGLKYINQIINNSISNSLEDVQCFARILSLLIHYEMGNFDVLEYLIKSTYRFIYKRKHIYRFEEVFLTFIRKQLPKTVYNKKQLIMAFKKLRGDLIRLFKDPYEAQVVEKFDFISWLESKIENRGFAEIVKEKSRNAAS